MTGDELRIEVDRDDVLHDLENWFPRLGDSLFEDSETPTRMLPFGGLLSESTSLMERHALYCDAYLRAADDRCGERPQDDVLIFPILFLYRHCLELALKEVAQRCPARRSQLTAGEIKQQRNRLDKEHSLSSVWRTITSIDPGCGSFARNARHAFESHIAVFDEHDPNSQGGRFAVST